MENSVRTDDHSLREAAVVNALTALFEKLDKGYDGVHWSLVDRWTVTVDKSFGFALPNAMLISCMKVSRRGPVRF